VAAARSPSAARGVPTERLPKALRPVAHRVRLALVSRSVRAECRSVPGRPAVPSAAHRRHLRAALSVWASAELAEQSSAPASVRVRARSFAFPFPGTVPSAAQQAALWVWVWAELAERSSQAAPPGQARAQSFPFPGIAPSAALQVVVSAE